MGDQQQPDQPTTDRPTDRVRPGELQSLIVSCLLRPSRQRHPQVCALPVYRDDTAPGRQAASHSEISLLIAQPNPHGTSCSKLHTV